MYVVFIHGPVAAGKYTIGSMLSERIDIPLYHNHLAVDLAKTLFDFGTPPFISLRENIWLASFSAAAEANQPFIFTFNPEATVDPALIARLQKIIENVGGQVYYVALQCADDEVLNRLDNASRAKFGKLLDKNLYQAIKHQGGFDFPPLPRALITIDTEEMTPQQAAQAIENALP